ncbi:Uncharacterised protein [uncultured archaeon]|nr:Uncharacterised protein [uncultured archaeon]
MKRLAIIFGIILFAALMANVECANPFVTVVGEGTVTVPADSITISVSVKSRDNNMTQAQDEVQKNMDKVVDALKSAGIKDEEILPGQSSGISSFHSSSKVCRTINNTTLCEINTEQISSLEKSAIVRLNTNDLSRIDRVVNVAESAGAKAYVAGYSLSDAKVAVADARQKAVANAKDNAKGMAEAAGVRLGKVVGISDYAYPDIGPADSYSGFGKEGMVQVTSYVVVTYEIVI